MRFIHIFPYAYEKTPLDAVLPTTNWLCKTSEKTENISFSC
jgi:hypothetical protein